MMTGKKRGEMMKRILEVGKHHEEVETRINEAIKDRSLADELCANAEERERKAVTNLLSFQQLEGSRSRFRARRWPA